MKASEAASAGGRAHASSHDDLIEPVGPERRELEVRASGPSKTMPGAFAGTAPVALAETASVALAETASVALAGLALPPPGAPLRRVAIGADPLGGEAIPGSVLAALKRRHGGGQPLPDEVAESAGQALSRDLSPVRVHTDPEADHIARSVQSVAFTHGSDIYFTAGSYRPGDAAGQHLLGHELAHVAQPESSRGGVIGRADDPAEAAADRAATGVVAALRRRAASVPSAGEILPHPGGEQRLRRQRGPTIRRLLDGAAMTALYGLTDGIVLANAALNGIFETDSAAVKAVIGGAPSAADTKALRLFLANGGCPDVEIRDRWRLLKSINAHLGTSMYRLSTTSPTVYLSTVDMTQLDTDIAATSAQTKALLATQAGDNLAGKKLQQALVASTVTTPSVDWVVREVHAAGGNTANPQLLSKDVRIRLQQVYNVHPRGTAHPVMAWGTGNWGSIAANITEHARKHMLRLGSADNPDQHEPFKWMTRLGYTVTKGWVEGQLGGATPGPDALAMYSADDKVETQGQADHFFNTFLPANAGVANALLALHEDTYRDNVVASATAMTNPIVTADGGKVQIVGQNGDLFIAGRWEGTATGFTISSGYLNTTKWPANQAMKAWTLT